MQKYLYTAAFILSFSNCLAMKNDPYHNSSDLSQRKAEKIIIKMFRQHPNRQIIAPKITADESADLINKSEKK